MTVYLRLKKLIILKQFDLARFCSTHLAPPYFITLLGVRIRSVCLARAHLTFEPTRDIIFSRRGMLTVGHVQEQCEQCGQCELL